MIGDGSTLTPAGVASSSVAVLGSGGFVLNSQLDASSVTKQGYITFPVLTGAVPTGSINSSTITTAIATKQNSFVGITSTTCSGYIDNSVLDNGVVTGGVCTAAAAGGVAANSTTTWSGNNYFVGATTIGASGTNIAGAWVAWTPTYTGYSAAPSNTARYARIGNTVLATLRYGSSGTSNATTVTITLPSVSNTTGNIGTCVYAEDNGAQSSDRLCYIYANAGSATASMYKDIGANAWTGSGGKNCTRCVIQYEAQ